MTDAGRQAAGRMGATLGATAPDSMAKTRTRPDNDREVNGHSRTNLNDPGTPMGNYGSDGNCTT